MENAEINTIYNKILIVKFILNYIILNNIKFRFLTDFDILILILNLSIKINLIISDYVMFMFIHKHNNK